MEHRCPECKEQWECGEFSCGYPLFFKCSEQRGKCNSPHKKPDPCDCDNCEYEKRFGVLFHAQGTICRLCGMVFGKHEGYHCPEKKEWKLPNGAKIIKAEFKDSWKIITASGNAGKIYRDDIPMLIKAFEEIGGRER